MDRIKIRVTTDLLGGVVLQPVCPYARVRIARSNKHDGWCGAYIQPWQVDEFLDDVPDAAWINSNGEREVDGNKVIEMDEWVYRYGYVGGQEG